MRMHTDSDYSCVQIQGLNPSKDEVYEGILHLKETLKWGSLVVLL